MLLAPLAALLVAPLSANDEAWVTLDQEIDELAASIGHRGIEGAPTIWGYAGFAYARSNDIDVDPDGELGGFFYDSLRVNVDGQRKDFAWRVAADFFNGDANLMFAWVDLRIQETVRVQIGQFKVPFLRTGLIERDRLLFIPRTRNAIFYSTGDFSTRGVKVHAVVDRFHGELAIQNGLDIVGDEVMFTARVTYDAVGDGVGAVEGAYGAPDDLAVSVGAAISDDNSADDGTAIAFEAAMTKNRFSLQAETVSYDDDYALADPEGLRGDTDPYSITGSLLIDEEETFELAARLDEFDDDLDRTLYIVGLNRYFDGHDAKLMLNYTHLDSDTSDEEIVALGVNLSF